MTFLRWTVAGLALALAGCSSDPPGTPIPDAGVDASTDLGDDDAADAGKAPDAGDDVPAATVSFAQVQAVFAATCVTDACHGRPASGRGGGAGGLYLTNAMTSFDALVERPSDQVPDMMLVAPGDPDNSYLIVKIEGSMRRVQPVACATSPGRNPCGAQMPQLAAPLTMAQRTLIRSWIQAGALPD